LRTTSLGGPAAATPPRTSHAATTPAGMGQGRIYAFIAWWRVILRVFSPPPAFRFWREPPRAVARACSSWYDCGVVRGIIRRWLPFVLALVALVISAQPCGAQGPEVERSLDSSQPFTLGVDTSRFRISTLGPRPVIATEDPSFGSVPYRLFDSDLHGTAVSFDLKLRWPSSPAAETSVLGSLEPYVSFGPTLFVTGADGTPRPGHPGVRSEGAMTLGLSWGAGLSWRFSRNAELFGGYRFMQYGRESGLSNGDRSPSETDLIGHDVLYGISVRF